MRVDRTSKLTAEMIDGPMAVLGSMAAAAAPAEGIGWIGKTLSRTQVRRVQARSDLGTRIGWRCHQSRDDHRLRLTDVAAVDMDVRTSSAWGEEEEEGQRDRMTRPYVDVCDSLVHVNGEGFHHPSHHRLDLDTNLEHIREVGNHDLVLAEVLDPAVDRVRHKSQAAHLACTLVDPRVGVAFVRYFGDGDTRYARVQMHALVMIQE